MNSQQDPLLLKIDNALKLFAQNQDLGNHILIAKGLFHTVQKDLIEVIEIQHKEIESLQEKIKQLEKERQPQK